TAPEEAVVEVWAQRSSGELGHELTVRVSDNGVGLPQQQEGPQSRGLGIQIVESLLTDLRGTLDWKSRSPHGTSVILTARLRPLTESSGPETAALALPPRTGEV
ncbi:MAG: ATP-binding protein, partial [Ornithinimicrobium sp.]